MFDEFDKTFGGVFPSPIGELHFSIATRTGRKFGKMTCFRPLSGSYISQSQIPEITRSMTLRPFPSPIGELHFSIGYDDEENREEAVSVPYRGATFLN